MGLYRFLLAATVVLLHLGGRAWIQGRVALFGFFLISGFLMFRILDVTYARNMRAYFANRFLRIFPMLVLVSILTWAFLRAGGPAQFCHPEATRRVLLYPVVEHAPDGLPKLSFTSELIPQSWSIGVECVFYLLAPLLLRLTRNRPWLLASMIGGFLGIFLLAALTHGIQYMDRWIYKNVLGSFWIFLLGGGVYCAAKRVRSRLPYRATVVLLVLYGGFVLLTSLRPEFGFTRIVSVRAWLLHLAIAVPVGVAVCFTKETASRVDWLLGKLTYGLFLNHLLMGSVLIHFGMQWNRLRFAAASLVLGTVFAALTYALVEYPIERLRKRIRPAG